MRRTMPFLVSLAAAAISGLDFYNNKETFNKTKVKESAYFKKHQHKTRSGTYDQYNSTPRFVRRKYGGNNYGYVPGRLFKGHRI